jgi:sigma-B regulation protein RsbU (phosphoserine phosphatase)
VSLLKSYIHTEAASHSSLTTFMADLNDFLFSVSLPTQYATATLFRVDEQGRLAYSNAAHPPFLLHRRSNGRTQMLEQPGNLLGAMPKMTYDEQTIEVSPGDTLFVYTDGLTDRCNTSGVFYSIDRVASLLERSQDADLGTLYDAIFADVTEFATTEEFKDDIAFVVTRFH